MLFAENRYTEPIHREYWAGWFCGYVGTWKVAEAVQEELPPAA